MKQHKTFLTQSDAGGGSIRWSVSPVAYYGPKVRFVEAGVTLTDCGRAVSLEFDSNSSKEGKERLSKLDTLISELTLFREELSSRNKQAYNKRYC